MNTLRAAAAFCRWYELACWRHNLDPTDPEVFYRACTKYDEKRVGKYGELKVKAICAFAEVKLGIRCRYEAVRPRKERPASSGREHEPTADREW